MRWSLEIIANREADMFMVVLQQIDKMPFEQLIDEEQLPFFHVLKDLIDQDRKRVHEV